MDRFVRVLAPVKLNVSKPPRNSSLVVLNDIYILNRPVLAEDFAESILSGPPRYSRNINISIVKAVKLLIFVPLFVPLFHIQAPTAAFLLR